MINDLVTTQKSGRKVGWRRSLIGPLMKVAKQKANDIAARCEVHTPYCKEGNWAGSVMKKRGSKKLDTMIVYKNNTQVTTTDPDEMSSALYNFWGSLFNSICEYEPDMLEKLLSEHPNRFPDIEKHEVDRKKVRELLMRTNKTVAGPDGIPFVAYKIFADELLDVWVAVIQEAGEDVEWDESFPAAQLILLPKELRRLIKVHEAPDFRPISITNSFYRLITRYWAKWLAEVVVGTMAKEQAAVVKGRTIDEVVERMVDEFMERVANRKKFY